MYRASYCNVWMNQQDAQLLTNNLYFSYFALHVSDVLSVHHQEHHLVNCIMSPSYNHVAARLACTNVPNA